MLRYTGVLLAAGGAWGQQTCTMSGSASVKCDPPSLLTTLPTEAQWGDYSVTAITGGLYLQNQEIAAIPDGGFDGCPYTAATGLSLTGNDITTVGARAFATLAALENLNLGNNAITWMAATSLDGVPRLTMLFLHSNRLGAFDYGALAQMDELSYLYLNGQVGGDPSCGGKNIWPADAAGIAAAVAACGSSRSPCSSCAVGCPADDPGGCPGPGLSGGAIAGIAVGSVAGVVLLGVVAMKTFGGVSATAGKSAGLL